jgi:hypothetical protein
MQRKRHAAQFLRSKNKVRDSLGIPLLPDAVSAEEA